MRHRSRASSAVTLPHRTDRGPALDRAWEGRPNHEEADSPKMGTPCGFYKLLRPAFRRSGKIEPRCQFTEAGMTGFVATPSLPRDPAKALHHPLSVLPRRNARGLRRRSGSIYLHVRAYNHHIVRSALIAA